MRRSLWLLSGLCMPQLSAAAPCAAICSTSVLWGIGSAAVGYQSCQCEGSTGARRSGPDCGCGECYFSQGSKVVGFAKLSDGSCPAGMTDCLDCDSASSSPTPTTAATPTTTTPTPPTTTTPPTTAPPTASPTPTGASATTSPPATPAPSPNTSSPSPPATATLSPANGSANTLPLPAVGSHDRDSSASHGSIAGATAESKHATAGLATWRILLIVCSCVLVFTVVITTIVICYCKSKHRMDDFLLVEHEAREYERYWHAEDNEPKAPRHCHLGPVTELAATRSVETRDSSSSNHSRHSERNLQQSEAADNERLWVGSVVRASDRHVRSEPALVYQQPPRSQVNKANSLPPVFQPFPPRERTLTEMNNRTMLEVEL